MPPATPVEAADENLTKMHEALRKLILDNGFITADSVKGLVEAGVISTETFYLLGNSESTTTTQSNLGKSY